MHTQWPTLGLPDYHSMIVTSKLTLKTKSFALIYAASSRIVFYATTRRCLPDAECHGHCLDGLGLPSSYSS